MNRVRAMIAGVIVLAAVVFGVLPVGAQQKRPSPNDVVSAAQGEGRVTIYYSRPYTKDPKSGEAREIFGKLVPWGKAWRTGANEATTLLTDVPLTFGSTTIPPGGYTIYLVPMEKGDSKLAFSKHVGQLGEPVDETQDVARVDMKMETLDKAVDQFTIAVEKEGVLKLSWAKTQFSAPFKAGKKAQ